MALYTEVDARDPKSVTVVTYGSAGQQIARTTWPSVETALEFANRQADLCGGAVTQIQSDTGAALSKLVAAALR